MTSEPINQATPETGVTVEGLYKRLRALMEQGHGDLPVYIVYETVFSRAKRVDVVKRQSRRGLPGVFIEE